MFRLFLLGAIASSCSGPYTDHPLLTVDCTFSEEEISVIQASVDTWSIAFPALARQVIETCEAPQVINGWPSFRQDSKPATTAHFEHVWLNMSLIHERHLELQPIVTHELGHFFGIQGHLPPGNIMSKSYRKMSYTLTEADILAMEQVQ